MLLLLLLVVDGVAMLLVIIIVVAVKSGVGLQNRGCVKGGENAKKKWKGGGGENEKQGKKIESESCLVLISFLPWLLAFFAGSTFSLGFRKHTHAHTHTRARIMVHTKEKELVGCWAVAFSCAFLLLLLLLLPIMKGHNNNPVAKNTLRRLGRSLCASRPNNQDALTGIIVANSST